MKTSAQLPSRRHWTAHELTNAITPRLSAMPAFTTAAGGHGGNDSRYSTPLRRELRGRYLAQLKPLILFRVHN